MLTRAWFAPGLRLEPHAHPAGSVAVVLRGGWEGELERRPLDLRRAESAVVTPSGARHSNRFGGELTEVLVIETSEPSGLGGAGRRLLSAPATVHERGLRGLARRIAAEIDSGPDEPLLLQGMALELLGTVARLLRREREGGLPSFVERARQCLHDAPADSWGLSALARAAGVSPARLVRGFRRYLRTSPGDYLRGLRVARARELLVETELPIAEIALTAGFTDQSHLTRVFRARLGDTPAALRVREARRSQHQAPPLSRRRD